MTSVVDLIHPTAVIDADVTIGPRSRVWHFCHVSSGVRIGADCTLGQNVFVAPGVAIGNNVKLQNNVSVYEGVELEDDVFCGPSCVFTNISNPRAAVSRRGQYAKTVVRRGATIGANATVVCGSIIGRHAFIGAGTVLTKAIVPDYALMVGVPARRVGWMSRHGQRLLNPDADGVMRCADSGWRYREIEVDVLRCIDRDEEAPL